MSDTSPSNLPLSHVVVLLAVTSLAGAALMSLATIKAFGVGFVVLIPYVALFFCLAAAVLVLPLMVVWPPLRRPGYLVAAMWGAASGPASALFLDYRGSARWYPILMFGAVGAASGLIYAHLARRQGL